MWYALAFVVAMLIVVATMPRPKSTMKPSELEAQTSNEESAIPVVFGTRDIGMNITWNGASYARAYKKKGGKK